MSIIINGTSGISGVDGSAATPSIQGSDANTGIYYPGEDQVAITTGGTAAVTVDASQRVGIGTTSPGSYSYSDLVVAGSTGGMSIVTGTSDVGRLVFADGVAGVGAFRGAVEYDHTADALRFASNGGEKARIDSSGRLLVGTSTAPPANTADVVITGGAGSGGAGGLTITRTNTTPANGNSLGSLYFADSSANPAAKIESQRDAGTWTSGSSQPSRLVFSTTADGASSPTERMRITSHGEIRITQSTTGLTCINTGGNGTAIIYFQTASAELGKIRINGAGVAYDTTSDYRLKENVEPITGAIDRVQALKPWRFNFISHPEVTVDGFLAHEAQEVVPEAVGGTKDEVDDNGNPIYQGIDQSKLVPLLTAALQEAVAKIETLEAQNAQFEARLTALEGGTN